ncbi:hypothetical protein FA95DRAFT_1552900 [Auriscalpium vulgare]|uniref:Uncharacterized protein n=1 Tax=Auriscalpium vulgare TaxID=40419 RepID=A0ACB8S9Y8_9AGAM|nr:hypothetical protein FA95DRAFT_1552900 [Auriscalpium vulgare]
MGAAHCTGLTHAFAGYRALHEGNRAKAARMPKSERGRKDMRQYRAAGALEQRICMRAEMRATSAAVCACISLSTAPAGHAYSTSSYDTAYADERHRGAREAGCGDANGKRKARRMSAATESKGVWRMWWRASEVHSREVRTRHSLR